MSEPLATHAARLQFFYCGRGDTILLEAGGMWGLIDCNLTRPSQADHRLRRLIEREKIKSRLSASRTPTVIITTGCTTC